MLKSLLTVASVLALAGCAGELLTWKPDAAPVYTQPGNTPVTTLLSGEPISARDWACRCQCVKGCLP